MRPRAEAAPSFLYAPGLGEPGARLELSDSEDHYLSHVCRARPGDIATVTDGRGAVGRVRVVSLEPRVVIEIESVEHSVARRRAWVWSGAPEGQRADWLVEKLAELGVESWQPLQCARGEWKRGAARAERWSRLALAAMRQSRRSILMEVRDPIGVDEAIARAPAEATRWLASPEGPRRLPDSTLGLAIGVIGPAEGFTAAETTALRAAGFSPICLADGRLRSESASMAWALWWGLG